MAKLVNYDKIKYQYEADTIVPGYYTLHRPSQCNLKFPKDNRPIHKKLKNAYEGKTTIALPQNGKMRNMIIPGNEKIVYPAIWHQNEYEKLKQRATLQNDPITIAKRIEEEAKRKAIECEKRRQLLDAKFKTQPGHVIDNLQDSKKSNQVTKTLKRAEGMKHEEFQGARIANQIIMAAKCHAIRDEQVKEKALIAKELEEENKRLDIMMEEDRLAALEREQNKTMEQKSRRLQNIKNIKEQIANNEKSKLISMERTQLEVVKNYQDGVAVELTELEKLQKKRENAMHLKALLDKANEELRFLKHEQKEASLIMDERIKVFKQQRQEREARLKAESDAKKAAKNKDVDTIATALMMEQQLRGKSEKIRNLKIKEDVEREYRAREKAATIKKINDIEKLKEAREKQIANIRRQIAMEMAMDEEILNNVMKKNEEDMIKEEKMNQEKRQAIKEFQKSTMEQVNSKASKRTDDQKKNQMEDLTYLSELKRLDVMEKEVVKNKVQRMREQNIPEKYVKEVEQRLAKLKYY